MTMFIRRLTALWVATLTVTLSLAMPALPVRQQIELADGSVTEATLMGDEHYHYWLTDDQQVIDTDADGRHFISSMTPEQAAGMRHAQSVRHAQLVNRRRASVGTRALQPKRGLVILANFSDRRFAIQNPRTAFSDMLNKQGYNTNGATGSTRDYFNTSSMGRYVPDFDVVGPVTLSQTEAYYARNSMEHVPEMIVEACRLVDDQVDFTRYDDDEDDYIDFVFVYYAGYSQAEGAGAYTIWPHRSVVYPGQNISGDWSDQQFDGKYLYDYACTAELRGTSGTQMCGIGTFTHEFGHVLGLPDFYETNYSTYHKTLGQWDIMDAGSYCNDQKTPPSYSAYERTFMGWLVPDTLDEAADISLPNLHDTNKAYYISSNDRQHPEGGSSNSNIYYLVENRQRKGWDAYLPGHGMLLTRIAYDRTKWRNNTVNNSISNMGVDIIEADGYAPTAYDRTTGYYGKQGDCYPTPYVQDAAPTTYQTLNDIYERDSVIYFGFRKPLDGVSVKVLYDLQYGWIGGAGKYKPGDTVRICVQPTEGYVLYNWGSEQQTGDTLTFIARNDTLIRPVFVLGGRCGEHATWRIVAGTLYIEGNGDINDYTPTRNPAPWTANADQITSIHIGDGITGVGTYAFFTMTSVRSIELPATIRRLGNNAFQRCTSLTSLKLSTRIPPETEANTFMTLNTNVHIIVPCQTLDKYRNTWTVFTTFEEVSPCEDDPLRDHINITDGMLETDLADEFYVYDIYGRIIAHRNQPGTIELSRGMYIIHSLGQHLKIYIK